MRRYLGPTLAAVAAVAAIAGATAAGSPTPTDVSVYAANLYNPKGIAFAPNGTLYVAESGPPGNVKVPLPVNFGGSGPIGTRAAVARIPRGGGRAVPFVTHLPNIGLYGGVEMLGAADVKYFHGKLYEVAAGHMTVSPKLSLVGADGRLTTVADVGAFNDDNPPPESNGDAVPFGNPFAMAALGDHIFISDGNYNTIIEATPKTGALRLFAIFRPDPTTTGLTVGPDGKLYVAQYGNAPYLPGSGQIDTVTAGGKVTKGVVKGLTTPIATAFAKDGTMYVLEYAAKFDAKHLRYVVNTGGIFRIDRHGGKHPVVTNLMFPTAMAFGPDGALYVTDFGNEANSGQGVVLRVVPGDTAVRAPKVPLPKVHGTYDVPKSNETFAAGKKVAGAIDVNIVEPKQVLRWGFSPNVLHAKVGQKIVVTNTGRISHTLTSTTGAFDTGLVKGGRSAILVINKAGTYKFICTPHPWMKGTLVVSGKTTAAAAKDVAVSKTHPPSLNPLTIALVVGGILVGVYLLARLARRPTPET